MTEDTQKKHFSVQQLCMHESSFERHEVTELASTEWKPDAKLEIDLKNKHLRDNTHEVKLKLALKVKLEDTPIFTINYSHIGLFQLQNLSEDEQEMTLSITCPHVMYPYAVEAINSLVQRAGYPAIYLTPVDFNEMHTKRKAQDAKKAGTVIEDVSETIH